MTYDEEVINQIVENIDLLEYVGESIDLTKRGSDYFGRCPLHIDKTPSFSVTPSKNRFFLLWLWKRRNNNSVFG